MSNPGDEPGLFVLSGEFIRECTGLGKHKEIPGQLSTTAPATHRNEWSLPVGLLLEAAFEEFEVLRGGNGLRAELGGVIVDGLDFQK